MSRWTSLQLKLRQARADPGTVDHRQPILHVDIARQCISRVTPGAESDRTYPVSTSRHGTGEQRDSYQTPRGLHRVAQKIGAGEPPGRVFKSRQPTEQVCLAEQYSGEGDVITSRILWLEGLEPGLNAGGEVDSHERYIYIHGTPDEARLGQPASIGCIRMRDQDVIELFDQVDVGQLVYVE